MKLKINDPLKYLINYMLLLVLYILHAVIAPDMLDYNNDKFALIAAPLGTIILFYSANDILNIITIKFVSNGSAIKTIITFIFVIFINPVGSCILGMHVMNIITPIDMSIITYVCLIASFMIIKVRNNKDICLSQFIEFMPHADEFMKMQEEQEKQKEENKD